MLIDIRTLPDHDNAGYLFSTDELAILFDYVDTFGDQPSNMLAVLFPNGRPEPTYCEHGHDVPAGQPIIDIPDRTFCFMCPTHFHDASAD